MSCPCMGPQRLQSAVFLASQIQLVWCSLASAWPVSHRSYAVITRAHMHAAIIMQWRPAHPCTTMRCWISLLCCESRHRLLPSAEGLASPDSMAGHNPARTSKRGMAWSDGKQARGLGEESLYRAHRAGKHCVYCKARYDTVREAPLCRGCDSKKAAKGVIRRSVS